MFVKQANTQETYLPLIHSSDAIYKADLAPVLVFSVGYMSLNQEDGVMFNFINLNFVYKNF